MTHDRTSTLLEVVETPPLKLARRTGAAGAFVALAVGAFMLMAWLSGHAAQWSARGVITVKANMALALCLAGAVLLIGRRPTVGPLSRFALLAAAALVFLIGALTFVEHLGGWNLGIDQLLASEAPGAPATVSPNRIGPPGAVSLALIGIALWGLVLGRSRIVPYAALAVAAITLVPAVGHFYGIEAFYGKAHLTGIAWPSVVALLALTLSLLLASSHQGPVQLLLRDDPGGKLLRALLPAILVVPIVLGLLRLLGELRGWYDTPTGTGMLVLALTGIFSVMIWRSAARLSRAAHQQRAVEEGLRRQTERLQLLSDAAGLLLAARKPDAVLRELFPRLATHLTLDGYFNFIVNETRDALELHSCVGVPDGMREQLTRLEFGQAICGTVAQSRQPIIATHIQQSADPKADLVRSLGIRGYVCNPLMIGERLVGTLSFASRTRDQFEPDELELLRLICQHVSVAVERLSAEKQLAQSNVQLDAEVQKRTTKLRDTVAELESYSYTIVHDLRAPLRAMQSFASLLEQDCGPEVSATGRDYLRRIRTAATRMDQLIRDVLSFSQISRGEVPVGRVDLDSLIAGILESYPTFQPPNCLVSLQRPLPPVLAAEALLTQCISNLLSNAVKFVAPGAVPHVDLRAEQTGSLVRLWVADNGIGIDPSCRDRIFEPFERLSTEFEGTGIGLAIVRKAVERMGGRVGVESEPGHGSRFWIELQRAGPDRNSFE